MNDAFGHPQSLVVLGGTSDIARRVVAQLAGAGAGARCRTVVLAGRDTEALAAAAAEVDPSVGRKETVTFDATETADAAGAVGRCFAAAGEPVDLVLVAVGELGRQDEDENSPERAARMVTVNFTWPAAAITEAAARLRAQGHGRIVVLSSVAGVRVRRANFFYGSAKAGLDGFAMGMAEALRGSGASLQIVRPGFVHTKMTAGMDAAPFAVDADTVAADIVRGIERGDAVIWSPPVLRWVFSLLRLLPQAVWRKLPG